MKRYGVRTRYVKPGKRLTEQFFIDKVIKGKLYNINVMYVHYELILGAINYRD